MVPVNMAGTKKKMLKSLHAMFNDKVFATQDGQTDERMNTIHYRDAGYVDAYDSHMNQTPVLCKEMQWRCY